MCRQHQIKPLRELPARYRPLLMRPSKLLANIQVDPEAANSGETATEPTDLVSQHSPERALCMAWPGQMCKMWQISGWSILGAASPYALDKSLQRHEELQNRLERYVVLQMQHLYVRPGGPAKQLRQLMPCSRT